MCQTYSPGSFGDLAPDTSRDKSRPTARRRLLRGLALGALVAADLWLAMRLAHAIGAVLAQPDAPLILALAAIGHALEAGAAMLLTWMLIEDHTGIARDFS
jgi:hypothetical protein